MFKEDPKVTARLIADKLGIPTTEVLRILRRENCAQDSAAIIRKFLSQKQVATLNLTPPPPYSPDLSPPDYFLFPKVKLQLKGARFDTSEGIQKAVTDQLNKIQTRSNAMKNLETSVNLCITTNGSHSE
jgi:histone-lysine N-methyltransferase SETMAR